MKVVHFTPCSPNTTLASSGIALWLAKEFKLGLIDTAEKCVKDDTYLVVNSPWAFCDFRDKAQAMIKGKRVIWVQNDFAIDIPTAFRGYEKIWTTCSLGRPNEVYMNWNQLTYIPVSGKAERATERILYYGAFREDRRSVFEKYLKSKHATYVSCSRKASAKFLEMNPKITILSPFNPRELMASVHCGLYIQDKTSDKEYHSPANRFYEYMSGESAILFDQPTQKTMEKAGYDVSEYLVNSADEFMEKSKEWKKIAEAQSAWRKDYRGELRKIVSAEIEKLA